MLGYIAALLFVIAFILRVTSTGTGVVFAPQSLLLAGLAPPAAARRPAPVARRYAPPPAAPVSGTPRLPPPQRPAPRICQPATRPHRSGPDVALGREDIHLRPAVAGARRKAVAQRPPLLRL